MNRKKPFKLIVWKRKCILFSCFFLFTASSVSAQMFTIKNSPAEDTIYISDEFDQRKIHLRIINNTKDTLFFPGLLVTNPQYPFKWVLGAPYWSDDVFEYPDKIKRDYSKLDSIRISWTPYALVMILQYMSNDSLVPYKPFAFIPDYIGYELQHYDSLIYKTRFQFHGAGDMFYFSRMKILPPHSKELLYPFICDFRPYNLKKGEYYRFSLFYYVYPSHSGWLEDENLFKNYNTPKHSIQSDEIIVKYE